MTVRKYSECKDIFWDEKSFHYSLEELCIWDIEKYWSLEYFLIKLCASLQGNEILYRKFAADLYYLGHSINNLMTNQIHTSKCYILEKFNEDEACECLDRFNHIMRILWGRISFDFHDYMIISNPLIQDELNLSR